MPNFYRIDPNPGKSAQTTWKKCPNNMEIRPSLAKLLRLTFFYLQPKIFENWSNIKYLVRTGSTPKHNENIKIIFK